MAGKKQRNREAKAATGTHSVAKFMFHARDGDDARSLIQRLAKDANV